MELDLQIGVQRPQAPPLGDLPIGYQFSPIGFPVQLVGGEEDSVVKHAFQLEVGFDLGLIDVVLGLAELPGVKKEDIEVSIDGNHIAISAEVKKEHEEKNGERVLRSERYYGKFSRSFQLAQDVDESTAQAKYSDGVLQLVLPKKAAVSAKKLYIQ